MFVPEAYITATRQFVAQANNWSLEELALEVQSFTKWLRLSVCSFVRVLVCTSIRLCVCSFVRVLVCSSVRLFVCSCACLFVCSCVRLFVCSFVRLFLCSFVRLFVYSSIRLFVCLFVSCDPFFVCLFVVLIVRRRLSLLTRKANARNVSFRSSLLWPIFIINSADKTKLPFV